MTKLSWLGLFLWLLGVSAALAAGACAGLWSVLNNPGPHSAPSAVYIKDGASLFEISEQLEAEGFVRSSILMRWSARLSGVALRLRAGEFEVEPGLSYIALGRALASATPVQRTITLPEGITAYGVAHRLSTAFGLTGASDIDVPEGYILPDTYAYSRGSTAADLLSRMRQAQSDLLLDLWDTRAPGLPYDTPEEAVIMASIIERETAVAGERDLVASVFINRLRRGMRLQSDPTVIYGIVGGAPFGRSITRQDLMDNNPYNTYRRDGLPAGPIANPGRASLIAAFKPADTNFLYFVADGAGGHVFAETLAQHNRNVRRWRALQRK